MHRNKNRYSSYRYLILLTIFTLCNVGSPSAQKLNHKYPRVSIQQSWVQAWQTSILQVLAKADLIQADLEAPQIAEIRRLNPNAVILPFWSVRENKAFSDWWRRDIIDNFRSMGFDGMYVDLWNDQSENDANNRSRELRQWWPDGIHIVNYGLIFDYSYELNGCMIEDFTAGTASTVLFGHNVGYDDWEERGQKPTMIILNDRLIDGDKSQEFDFWKKGRYVTGISMLRDGIYVMFNYGGGGSPHWASSWWFDEFDLDVGQPMGDAKTISECFGQHGGAKPCVWVREFTNGLVIVNDAGEPRTITSSQLASKGFSSNFWRFQGGQQPDFNNGSKFDSVTLDGWIYQPETHYWQSGDAIILLKSPQTVVADIVVDDESPDRGGPFIRDNVNVSFTNKGFSYNLDCGTDPPEVYECPGPQFPGSWGSEPRYSCHFAYPGNGSAEALWSPKIGLAGEYEVFEWHSDAPNGQATNAPFTIMHANGETTINVDQTKKGSMWNSLGVYTFSRGQSGYVKLTNNANGLVIADAIRIVYKNSDSITDSSAPNPPKGVKVDGK